MLILLGDEQKLGMGVWLEFIYASFLYHYTMLYVNKNGIFIAFLSYFSGPLFNGEEGPNLEIFEELKKFLGAHNKEAQIWNDSRHIPNL